jgi:hypothetical protein
MLDLMLGNSPDAFSCGEVYAWFRPWRRHHFKLECRCGQDPCPVWEKVENVRERQLYSALIAELKVNFVIDSSKDVCWLVDTQQWAVSDGIAVYNLLLWKNPVDLAYSYWKRGWGLEGWHRGFVSYYSRFLDTELPFRSVYFDDLVSEPEHKLEDICAAVGMPYFKGKERFWEKQHHHLFGSYGTYRQVRDKSSAIRESEVFPPEFEAQVDTLSHQIATDPEIQRILKELERSEVSSLGGFDAKDTEFLVSKPYPYWYYLLRARQIGQRYFPDRAGPVE